MNLSERVDGRVGRLCEPAWAIGGHVDVILKTDAEFLRIDQHGFVGEAHAGHKRLRVAAHDVRSFVDFQSKTMASPMRQAGKSVIRSEPMPSHGRAGRRIEIFAWFT